MNGANQAALLNNQSIVPAIAGGSEIVFAAQAGSPGAFAELHATYAGRLYKTIVAITRNPEDAEDALQDTFLRAYLALHTFEGRSSVYSWLTRIAINSALMILRRRRARPEILFDPQPDTRSETVSLDIADPAPNPEEFCALRQRRLRILSAIRNLDPHLRGPVQMQMARGCSIREIGQALNLSEAAVKTRLHRARLRLFAAQGFKQSTSASKDAVRRRT